MKNSKPEAASKPLKIYRVISILLLIGAIGYFAMPYDFDHLGWIGYVDDFFVFMAAFMFVHGSWQKAERHFIRRQLYSIAAIFLVMAFLMVFILNYMK